MPIIDLITPEDYERYKNILLITSVHLKQKRPDGHVHVSRGAKYRNAISKLFPRLPTDRQKRRGAALRVKQWLEYKVHRIDQTTSLAHLSNNGKDKNGR
jgi:hypothetical protein